MLAALGVLCAVAWTYLFHLGTTMSGEMGSMSAAMPMANHWSAADTVSMFVMWAVMMVAMMLPSVVPMVLLYSRAVRHRRPGDRHAPLVALFVAGYLLAWLGFSVLATAANWGLHRGGLLSAMMGTATPLVGGLVLIAAGVYQWTPLKEACLRRCRSPIGFLTDHWREGRFGAAVMGLQHGAYCVGCCWLLMALLFVLGVMNLVWIAALTAIVLVEKISPWGRLAGRTSAGLLVAWGAWLMVTGG